MKKDYLYIIIAALVLFNLYTINSMDRNIQEIRNEQNDIQNEIRDIYSNVDEKLEKQASILDSYDITFGNELNMDDLTVPVNVTVTPKENTENLTAGLLINNETHPMLKNGATFAASADVFIFDPFEIKVVLENSGTEKVETIDEYTDLYGKYLVDLDGGFSGSTKYSSGKYKYDGDIVINFFGSENGTPEKVSVSKYINGTFIDEQEVDMQGNHSIMYSVKDEAELSANDKIEIYVNFQDKYGLNYKYIVLADEIDSKGHLVPSRPEWTNGSITEIKDKNGRVLFEGHKYQ